MEINEIKTTLESLTLGDKLAINDWHAKYTVCGISPHYVLAHYGQHYTIISKVPYSGIAHNGVRDGEYYCGPDWWIFGYSLGYNFTDRDWVGTYLADLESGDTEISIKKHAPLYFVSVVGHTDKVYKNKDAKFRK